MKLSTNEQNWIKNKIQKSSQNFTHCSPLLCILHSPKFSWVEALILRSDEKSGVTWSKSRSQTTQSAHIFAHKNRNSDHNNESSSSSSDHKRINKQTKNLQIHNSHHALPTRLKIHRLYSLQWGKTPSSKKEGYLEFSFSSPSLAKKSSVQLFFPFILNGFTPTPRPLPRKETPWVTDSISYDDNHNATCAYWVSVRMSQNLGWSSNNRGSHHKRTDNRTW